MGIAIFGSGHFGRCALRDYGTGNVECFIDNDPAKKGEECGGKRIFSLDAFLERHGGQAGKPHIVVAVFRYAGITEQLRDCGITDYEVYDPAFYRNFLDLKEAASGTRGKVALLGMDGSTEAVLQALAASGLRKEQLILTDTEKPPVLPSFLEPFPYLPLEQAVAEAGCVAVSSSARAYALQARMEREYPETRILNPFILKSYGDAGNLVVNPYEGMDHEMTEQEWIRLNGRRDARIAVQSYLEELARQHPVLKHIEIETLNRCNGACDFCPVSAGNERRPMARMEEGLFYSIIDQLAEMDYAGRLATFSNNEPFLDKRIVPFNQYARKKLPRARLHLFTNGTVLSLEDFIGIMGCLDELVIDNYQQDLELIPTVKAIVAYCEGHPELKERVTVFKRKPHEIRTSRGGDAPNRARSEYLADLGCVLPFKQMIIRPDGKVSLCCNDPYGKYTLGDLKKERLVDVWNGETYQKLRQSMLLGRKAWGDCRFCDTVIL